MGWDSEVKYIIKEYNKKTKLYSGTLEDGQFGVDNICLEQGKCYSFDVTDGYRVGNSLWALCGYVKLLFDGDAQYLIMLISLSERTSILDGDFNDCVH